jgi:Xaa-Pro aminopeptidase
VARREAARRAFDLSRGAVLVPAGLPVVVAGTDEPYEFRVHPEHRWLTGLAEPGALLAFDPGEGFVLFFPERTEEERVWSGPGPDPERLREESGLDRIRPRAGLTEWLGARHGEPLAILGNPDFLSRFAEYDVPGWPRLWPALEPDLSTRLSKVLDVLRRRKDGVEIALLRRAAEISAAGHAAAAEVVRPGMTERELMTEVCAVFRRLGSRRDAYAPIVAGGENASVLHFAPTDRPFADGDLVLVDAGAEYGGLMGDVTRTLPAGGRFEPFQRDVYEIVLAVEEAAIARARPGVEYRDLHLSACTALAAGLVELGLLRGNPESLVERDAHALFFPHGLGHMLGLATHDAGGYLEGRPRSDRFGLKWLRTDLPLEAGHVVTIEPGIYFIRPLLTNRVWRERFREEVAWDRVDRLLGFGGIRIEDDVHVTAAGPEVLTHAAPKRAADLEAARRPSE